MKVLHLLKTATGALWALRQMRELVRLGIEVHVALPPGPLIEKYTAHGIHVHLAAFDFPARNVWQLPQRLEAFRQLIKQIQPDIIHSHFVGTTLIMRLALGNRYSIPRIFQVPGPLHLERSFFRRLELGSASSMDHWIGACHWTVELYRQAGIPDSHLFTSFHGSDIENFEGHPAGKVRRELNLSEQSRIVGMVAYIYAPKAHLGQTRGLKGHEDLIDALAQCLPVEPNLMGVIVGGAWANAHRYEQKVREYARQKCGDKIHFLGTRHDVLELYPDFEIAVHPSHSENHGGAQESLLMGVPTIATNVGGFPDVVHPGITGWLVPPKSPNHLAAAILEALAKPEYSQTLARNGQQYARKVFDVRVTANEVAGIYRTILRNH